MEELAAGVAAIGVLVAGVAAVGVWSPTGDCAGVVADSFCDSAPAAC